MIDQIEDEYITEDYKIYANLEDLVFETTEESLNSAFDVFSKNKFISSKFLDFLIISAASVRPHKYQKLAELWKKVPIMEGHIPLTPFTDYLMKLGLIPNNSVMWSPSKKTVEELENVFTPNTLFSFILNDDIDNFSFYYANMDRSNMETTTYDDEDLKGKALSCIDVAAMFGATKIFKFLWLQSSPITDITLKCSVMGGDISIIEKLVENNYNFEKCLSIAVRYHRNEVASWLLENCECEPVNLITCIKCFNSTMIPYIIYQGTDMDVRDDSRRSPLHIAVQLDSNAVVKYLANVGFDIETTDNHYRTILIESVKEGNKKIVEFCLERGANIEAQDYCHQTALIWASKVGHKEILEFLLKEGANKQAKDNYGRTCIDLSYSKEIFDLINNE